MIACPGRCRGTEPESRHRVVDALRSAIADAGIRRLPPTGTVDQFIDSTDAIGDIVLLRATAAAAIGRSAVVSAG